jgi:hypothetical protein
MVGVLKPLIYQPLKVAGILLMNGKVLNLQKGIIGHIQKKIWNYLKKKENFIILLTENLT